MYAYTDNEIKQILNYHIAAELSTFLLERGLISLLEFDKLEKINRQSFSHLFLELMPNKVDK